MSRPKPAAPRPAPDPERLYTLPEAAEKLRVCVRTLRRMRDRRTLRVVKLGRGRGVIRIPQSELTRLATEGTAR